jgi:hypothetical protein
MREDDEREWSVERRGLETELAPQRETERLQQLDQLINEGDGIAYDYRQPGPPLAKSPADEPFGWQRLASWDRTAANILTNSKDLEAFRAPVSVDRTQPWYLQIHDEAKQRTGRVRAIKSRTGPR